MYISDFSYYKINGMASFCKLYIEEPLHIYKEAIVSFTSCICRSVVCTSC